MTGRPPPDRSDDPDHVVETLRREDPSGLRFGRLLRDSLDQAYDGVHTGRYRWDQLHGTERTHFGSILAINLQRAFAFDDAPVGDFRIGGIDVGVVFAPLPHRWAIPARLIGLTCLGVTADDVEGRWAVCAFDVDRSNLDQTSEGALQPSPGFLGSVAWVWDERSLPPNVLARLPDQQVEAIFDAGGRRRSGQGSVDELFRLVRDRRIGRGAIATVARQHDYMRRVRQNGGSRTNLRPEGIVILGQYESHRVLADRLGVPVPEEGEFVSTRLVPDPGGVFIDGSSWRRARPDDPVVTAPVLPPT